MGFGRRLNAATRLVALVSLVLTAPGCALLNGFLDPTQVGQFPQEFREGGIRRILTPRDTPPGLANATEPVPEDLVPEYSDYRLGPGDVVGITVEDLIAQGQVYQSALEISSTGYIRLPILNSVKIGGLSDTQAEQLIKSQLKEGGYLPDPIVQVIVQVRRSRYFTIIGAVQQAGPYPLTEPDTRLLDVIGLARDVDSTVKKAYVIRREENGSRPKTMTSEPLPPTPTGEGLVIPPPVEEPERGGPGSFFTTAGHQDAPATKPKDQGVDDSLEGIISPAKRNSVPPPNVKRDEKQPFAPLIYDPQTGKPVQVQPEKKPEELEKPAERTTAPPPKQPGFNWEEVPEYELAQRVIEIDVSALKSGDPRYNIVIRDRDVINVPIDTGVFYLMGEINRPGVYALGGREITIKQAVALAGGLAPQAWPQRCELIRREQGTDKQITIPVNVDAIFAGLDDDVLLRDEDILNVGTHFIAPFLFVIRNSFRFTYGFGFVYDRNFADKDTYGNKINPEISAAARRERRGLPF